MKMLKIRKARIGCIALLIGICMVFPFAMAAGGDEAAMPIITDRPKITVDPHAGGLITPTPAPTEPGVAIQGWTAVKLPANALEASVAFYNPEENANWYDLTFELRLKDTEEVIFTTGLIPPGQYCNRVELTRPMEKGVYAAILHVQPYYQQEGQLPTNDLNMDIRLIVE